MIIVASHACLTEPSCDGDVCQDQLVSGLVCRFHKNQKEPAPKEDARGTKTQHLQSCEQYHPGLDAALPVPKSFPFQSPHSLPVKQHGPSAPYHMSRDSCAKAAPAGTSRRVISWAPSPPPPRCSETASGREHMSGPIGEYARAFNSRGVQIGKHAMRHTLGDVVDRLHDVGAFVEGDEVDETCTSR